MWQIFEFDQRELIRHYPELARCGSGACLGIALKWCAAKTSSGSSLKLASSLTGSPDQRRQVATWMCYVQDVPLAVLFNNKQFQFYAQGEAITDVIGNVKGKINNLQAYAYRLSMMSQWGRNVGLRLLDDRVGFGEGNPPAAWVPELVRYACGPGADRVIGTISVAGPQRGHTMAYQYVRSPATEINFFDPNLGEFCTTSAQDFEVWLTDLFAQKYAAHTSHWWVVKFA